MNNDNWLNEKLKCPYCTKVVRKRDWGYHIRDGFKVEGCKDCVEEWHIKVQNTLHGEEVFNFSQDFEYVEDTPPKYNYSFNDLYKEVITISR